MVLVRIRFLSLLAFTVLSAWMTACGKLADQPNDGQDRQLSVTTRAELEGTNWFLLSYGQADGQRSALENVEVSMGFDNYEDLHGFAGCNYYAKSFEINGQRLITSELERTRFSCTEDDVMVLDAAILDALKTVSTIGLEGDILVIGYNGGELRFEKEPPPPITSLTGTRWELMEIGVGDDVSPIIPGTTVTAAFRDGIMSGESGCNSYGGEYEINGTGFYIPEIEQTAELCMDEALMEQEYTFIDILRESKDYLLEGETLTISGSGKELRFERVDD